MPFSSDKVGINEGQLRAANPHVPYTAEEVAEDARRCYDAGASVIHFHGRTADGGAASDDPEINIETQRRITELTPLVAYPTYGNQNPVLDGYYEIGGPAEQRYRHFVAGVKTNVKFEVGPIDLGAALDVNAMRNLVMGDWVFPKNRQINTGEDHRWLTDFCKAHGLKMTFAVFDTANLKNLRNIVDLGWATEPPLLVKLFFLGNDEGPKKLVYYLDRMHELVGDKDPCWMSVVYGGDQFPMCTVALGLGGHVRVGLGDYHYADRGQPSNAQLVERIATVARAMGREPATRDEARAIQGINAAKEGRQ